jgi:hypothetical protein
MMSANLSGLAALAMMGFMASFGALILFMVLIQPIWCIVDCAVDNRRGAFGKVVWIILLVVLYGLANWFYGAFAASGRALKLLTRLAWAFALILLVGFAVLFFTHAEFRRGIEQEWHHRRELIVLADTVQVASLELQHGG